MGDGRGFFSEGGQTAEPASSWPDPRNQKAEWGPLPFDARHNVTSAAILDLPFGKGRRWLSDAPTWIDRFAGGWTVAAIWKAHTGFPITISAPDQSQTGARSGRPDQIGPAEGPHEVGPGHLWFDTSAFMLPKLGTFGNAGVGVGPWTWSQCHRCVGNESEPNRRRRSRFSRRRLQCVERASLQRT